MRFTFTDEAVQALTQRQVTEKLSLFYYSDAQDCGCPNTGIFALRYNDQTENEYDTTLDTNLGKVQAQKWALKYLDEDNQLDFKKSQGTFILKSERGYLNLNVPVEIKDTVR